MCEIAYLSIKNQELPGPLSRPWTPAADCSLHLHDSALLRRQLLASEAGAPLDQILDPHLDLVNEVLLFNPSTKYYFSEYNLSYGNLLFPGDL